MPNPKFTGKSLLQLLQEQLQAYSGDGCLLWEYATNAKGYGIMKAGAKSGLVHRFAYEIIHGHAPEGALRQTCGNRRCFAPPHLATGQRTNQGRHFNRRFEKYEWLLKAVAEHSGTDCLIWPFAKDPSGYGVLDTPEGNAYAHRLSFKIVHGRWPEPFALHTRDCTSRACIAPNHLYEGDQQQNMDDMVAVGHAHSPALKGEDHGRAKLTDADIPKIRAAYSAGGITMEELGVRYGVSRHAIWLIISGNGWKHL